MPDRAGCDPNFALADKGSKAKDKSMRKTKMQFLKEHWKKAALSLIALDVLVACTLLAFGGGEHLRKMVMTIFA